MRILDNLIQQQTNYTRASYRFITISSSWQLLMWHLSQHPPNVCRLLPAFRHLFLGRPARNEFIQQRLPCFGAQYAAQALNVFTLSAIAADDDGDAAIRHIDALIQDAAREQFAVLA